MAAVPLSFLACKEQPPQSFEDAGVPLMNVYMDCGLPGSSIHGIFQARVLEWGAIAFSREEPK